MAGPARVSGFGNYVVGSYRTSANIGAFLVTVKSQPHVTSEQKMTRLTKLLKQL